MGVKVAVLITCHNRKINTIHCLECLFSLSGLDTDFSIDIFLVDDASSDGTKEEVMIKFPQVNIIDGDGKLFWNRGMNLAWETAATTNENLDYYLWLNDDTFLYPDALNFLSEHKIGKTSIICGTTIGNTSKMITYGGFSKEKRRLITPDGTLQTCDYFNGNCVLIPKDVFGIVGNLDVIFHHAVGDWDYGLRAKKLGIKLLVAPNIVGICDGHKSLPKWRDPTKNVVKRLKALYSPSSGCYPTQFFVFDKRHNGILIAIFHFITIHIRAIFPSLWKIKEKN